MQVDPVFDSRASHVIIITREGDMRNYLKRYRYIGAHRWSKVWDA